jgi:hypothetical protein
MDRGGGRFAGGSVRSRLDDGHEVERSVELAIATLV